MLSLWNDYTERNDPDPADLRPELERMLAKAPILDSVLEVGCSRGANLKVLARPGRLCLGIEPNAKARELAHGLRVLDGDVRDLYMLSRASFDLVLCAGLLCHLGNADLRLAMEELWRVTRRYLLLVEYEAEKQMKIAWRGTFLWERPYGRLALDWLRGAKLLDGGEAGPLYDGARFWLLGK